MRSNKIQFLADRNFSHRALKLWFAAIIVLLTLSLSSIADAHPGKESSCTACHTLNDPDASISVFIDNVATTSIEVPNDGTASFEVDYFFSNATDTATYEGIGVEIAVPSGWGIAAGTNAFSPPGWNAAWDLADGIGWSPVFNTSAEFPNEPDGYTVNYDTSSWDIGNRDAACDNGGSCSSGTDQDGTIDTMGTDAIVSIPLGTPGGAYTVRVMGVGHHTDVKSYVSDLIMVTVTADVTSVLGEISPNNVVVNSVGNVFAYDILPTITGIATGVDRVEITAPTGYGSLNVTGASVGGSGLTANCPTPGAGQYCATVAVPVMTIDLGTKVTTSLTNIQITFTADAPASTGDDAFTSTVDDTGTARPTVTVTVGNADGNPGDNNSQTVTVVGNSLTWVGGNDTDFNNSLNWSPNRIPTLSDECIINSYSTFQPVIQSNSLCGSITMGTGGTVITLTFSGSNNLTVSGDIVIGANGRISPSGTPTGTFSIGGNWSDDIGTTNFTSSNLHLDYHFNGTSEPIFTDESFYDLHIIGDITLNSDLTVDNSLVIDNGAILYQGSNTIYLNASIFSINGTYDYDCNSLLEINSTLSLQSNAHYPTVTVNSGADVSGANPAYIDCDLTLQSGATFDPGQNLYLEGDWINNGATIDVNLTTVYFTGLNPQIAGTTQTDFYNLVIGDVPGTVINPTYNLSIAKNLTVSAGAELNITAGNDISVVENTSISGELNLSGTTTWNQGGGNNVGITVNYGGLLSAQGTDSGNRVTFTRSDTNYFQLIVNGGIDFQYVNLFYTHDATANAGIAIKSLPGETVNFDYVAINYTEDANGATMMYWDSNRTLNTTGVTFDSSTYIANDDNVEAVQGTINFSNYGGNFAGEALDNDNGGNAVWIAATTTIGDGTAPSNKTVAQNSINNAVSSFTLSTDSGGDTLTALTVTFSGTSASDVAASGVKIYKDDGTNPNEWDSSDSQIGSAVSFIGATATFGSLSEPINTTPTQYLITYDIAGGATSSNTLQGAVTAATVTNTLINNDSNDATLTVDSGPYNVFYSVGQSTVTNLMTGTPTMTISNGTATFSTPQTAVNMGIGDKVTYNGGDIAYISGKTSTSVWSLITARGSTPANVTNATVDSITHAYASLSAAEAGASDATHLNTTDLVTGDYVLHFPCYYDTGPDTTAVTIDGYTTGSNNYIKIYTPTDTSTEVNQSQRHDGKWNTGKYYIDVGAGSNLPLIFSDEHIRVDGLQITTTYVNAGTSAQAIYLNNVGNNADIRISNNVLNGGNVGTAGDWNRFGIIIQSVGSSSTARIWNNVIYEWGGRGWGMYINDVDVTCYVYNNTFYDNPWYGIRVANGSVIAKNNLIFGSGNSNTYSGTFTAGTDYNSTDSTDNIGQGSNNRISQTFTFVNTGADDYHLASTDTGALNRGVDLSGDPNLAFSVDIDGAARPIDGIWDMGADETAGSFTTTIGDGTAPVDQTVSVSSTNKAVNAFTLSTASGTDTLTALTVTRSGTSSDSDVASNGVKLWRDDGSTANEWDAADTQIGSGVSLSSGTASLSSLSESIITTPTQYIVTYDIASGAGSGNILLGAVTAATVSNTLVNNDTTDATLTITGVTCNVDPDGTYIEAEDFSGTSAGDGTYTFAGILSAQADYLGTGYLETDNNVNMEDFSHVNLNPGMYDRYDYQVNFPTTGTYQIWIRGYEDGSDADDSNFIGLDGTATGAIKEDVPGAGWEWTSTVQNGVTTITIGSAGIHTINVWPREQKHKLDALYITTGASVPTDGVHGIDIDPSGCATTTIGDGTAPVSRDVWAGGRFFGVDAFTLQTDSGTADLTALTVTFSGTNVSDIAASGVKLWRDDGGSNDQWDSTDTFISTAAAFVGNDATFSGFTEPINTSSTQYIITYNVDSTAGVGNTLQGTVTAATVSNFLVNNDTTDATLTVESDVVYETSIYKVSYSPGSIEDLFLKGTSAPATDVLTSFTMGNDYADLGAMIMSWDPDATVTTPLSNSVVTRLQMSGEMIDAAGDSFGPTTANISFYEDRIVFDLTVNISPNPTGTDYLFMTYGVWDDATLDETFWWSSNNSGTYNLEDPNTNFNTGNQTAPISFQTLFELGATDGLINATLTNISNYGTAQLKNTDPDTGKVDIAFQKVNPVIGSNIQTALIYSFNTTTSGYDTTITEERQDGFISPATLNFAIGGGDGALDGDGYVEERGAYTLNDGDADDHIRFQFEPTTTHHAPVFEITGWNSGAPAYIDVGGVLKTSGTHYNAAVTGTTLYLQYLSNISANTIIEIPSSCPGFVVTTTSDSGVGSLRECINLANSNPGADTITFDGGVFNPGTINVGSVLPNLNDAGGAGTIINGGSATNVIVNGSGAGAVHGFNLQSNSNEIRNITITSFVNNGIFLQSNSDNNVLQMNVIRDNQNHGISISTNADGTTVYHSTIHNNGTQAGADNGDGINIATGITGTILKNNILSNNDGYGVWDKDGFASTIVNYNDLYANVTGVCGKTNRATSHDCITGSKNITSDPAYNDEPGDDYTLTECTSPAINMACDLGAAGDDTFCDSAADGAQPDMNGATAGNFNNNAPDMGAYETGDCAPGLTIVKQVWEDGGTAPLGNPTAPVGATLVFLIYVKNTTAGPVTDLRINDDLDDAGFAYVADSLIMDDGSLVDSSSDEDIFDATTSGTGTPLSDVIDANVASSCDVSESLCPGTSADKITIGAVVGQANGSLSIDAHETFALRFEVKVK